MASVSQYECNISQIRLMAILHLTHPINNKGLNSHERPNTHACQLTCFLCCASLETLLHAIFCCLYINKVIRNALLLNFVNFNACRDTR